MKENLVIKLLFPLCLALASCAGGSKGTPVDVIIMSGQSNMVGCSTYSGLVDAVGYDDYSSFEKGMDGVKIAYDCWTKDGTNLYTRQNTSSSKFVNVFLGQGNSDLTFGPEIGMAKTWNVSRKGSLFLIKYACGVANLLDDFAAPSSGKKTTLYSGFVAYVRSELEALKKNGYDPTIKAMCWMQGEGDSYPGYYTEYYEQTSYLAKDLREEFKDYEDEEKFAFVDGGISNSDTWVYYSEVNAAKKQFAATSNRNVYIDTIANGLDKTTLQDDNAHYKGEYMVKLGKLFAEAVEPFLTSND